MPLLRERQWISIGITLILIGIALILIPLIIKLRPTIDSKEVPWILLYVYKKDGFFFATSPVLIIIGVIYYLWTSFLRSTR